RLPGLLPRPAAALSHSPDPSSTTSCRLQLFQKLLRSGSWMPSPNDIADHRHRIRAGFNHFRGPVQVIPPTATIGLVVNPRTRQINSVPISGSAFCLLFVAN